MMDMDSIMYLAFWVSILLLLFLYLDEKKFSIKSLSIENKNWCLNVPYTKLVKEIISFSGEILLKEKIKYYPSIEVKYYKSKKMMGCYNGAEDHITIYLKNHKDIPSIVDTVLHEVCHHIQNKSRNKEYKLYGHYTKKYGYKNNPLEIDSRDFAKKNTKSCIKFLESRNVISAK
jgi:hypothetical protein